MNIEPSIVAAFTPAGSLRASINLGNPILASRDPLSVGKGSAYDLFLSRLKAAQIVRAPTSPSVVQTFIEQNLEVAAGVKQQLEADAMKSPGLRLLDKRFMVIRQAMGTPKRRGDAAAATLCVFLEEMKASGFIADSMFRHGMTGARLAPAA